MTSHFFFLLQRQRRILNISIEASPAEWSLPEPHYKAGQPLFFIFSKGSVRQEFRLEANMTSPRGHLGDDALMKLPFQVEEAANNQEQRDFWL